MPLPGVKEKLIRPYEGPYIIYKVIPPSILEVCNINGKIKGQFNWKSMRFIMKQLIRFEVEIEADVGRGNLH
jgi:hypothetical protein